MTEKGDKLSRRSFLKFATAGAIALAAGAGGYYYYTSTRAPEQPISTSEIKGKIAYWQWDTTEIGVADTKERIKRLTDKYPDASVELTVMNVTDLNKRLGTAIAAKQGIPDVAETNAPTVFRYAAMGALVPLDEYLNMWRTPGRGSDAPLLKDDYFPFLLAYVNYKGHHYGFPITQGCNHVVVRKDMIREAGFKVPGLDTSNTKHDGTDDAWTWEQYKEVRHALTNKAKGIWGGGGSGQSPIWHLWSTLCYQQDLKIIFEEPKGSDKYVLDFDNDRGVAVMEEIVDEYQNTLPEGAVNWEMTDYQNLLKAKKLACYAGNPEPLTSMMREMGGDFPAAAIPPLKGKVKATKAGSRVQCIFNSPNLNLKTALEWCRYWMGVHEYKGKIYNYAYNMFANPVLRSDAKDPKYLELLKPDLGWIYGLQDGAFVARALPSHVQWGKISDAAAKYCQSVAIGKMTPEKANRTLVDETWQYLKET